MTGSCKEARGDARDDGESCRTGREDTQQVDLGSIESLQMPLGFTRHLRSHKIRFYQRGNPRGGTAFRIGFQVRSGQNVSQTPVPRQY